MNIDDETLFRVGAVLHEARMQECFGGFQPSWRHSWPATLKDFRAQRHAGQPWIDVACAQVRAMKKEGLI